MNDTGKTASTKTPESVCDEGDNLLQSSSENKTSDDALCEVEKDDNSLEISENEVKKTNKINGHENVSDTKNNSNGRQTEEDNNESDDVETGSSNIAENNSRSATPQNNQNLHLVPNSCTPVNNDEISVDLVEMEPLVLEEDAESELQFDENSDKESGKSSPTITRCITRRSQTRNIPTPKTPKLPFTEQNGNDSEQYSEETISRKHETVDEDVEPNQSVLIEPSQDDDSTKVTVGNESTRLNFTFGDEFGSSFLSTHKQTPIGDALRGLSVRRSIRSFDNSTYKYIDSDTNLRYQRRSVESISAIKRKRPDHFSNEENVKRNKPEFPGLLSYVTSPINNILNFLPEMGASASTPKLTSFKNKNNLIEFENANKIADDENFHDQSNKKWCVIM